MNLKKYAPSFGISRVACIYLDIRGWWIVIYRVHPDDSSEAVEWILVPAENGRVPTYSRLRFTLKRSPYDVESFVRLKTMPKFPESSFGKT